MARTVPTTEPRRLVAGDSWQWDKSISEFPAGDGWKLGYAFRGPSSAEFATVWNTDVVADGDAFQIRIAKTKTNLARGRYILTAYVENAGGEHFTVLDERGEPLQVEVDVLPNPATAVAAASDDEALLVQIEAAVLAVSSSGYQSATVNGRTVTYADLADLQKQLGEVRARVARARRGGRFQRMEVSFRRA